MISTGCVILFLVFILRIFYLQVLQGKYYQTLSLNNLLTYERIPAPRGEIYDRNGKLLAGNESVFELSCRKKYLDIDGPELQKLFTLDLSGLIHEEDPGYKQLILKTRFSFADYITFEENIENFPHSQIKQRFIRKYNAPEASSHVLGYVNRISQKEYAELKVKDYHITDYIGRTGLEKYYEEELKGITGEEIYLRDKTRGSRRTWQLQPAQPGNSLNLSIDLDLQKKASELLSGLTGSVIISNPHTGEILCMVSAPTYNPQYILTPERFNKEIEKEKKGWLNRSIQGVYPPGSTFKLASAYIGLKEQTISPATQYYCNGKFFYKGWNRPFKCDNPWGHGKTNVQKALKVSCNVFFYEMAYRTTIRRLYFWSEQFGFGKQTQIDLPFEAKGLLPNPAWKKRVRNEPWVPGDTLFFAIGQSDLLCSPIQVLQLYNIAATRGKGYRMHLLNSINDHQNNNLYTTEPKLDIDLSGDTEIWDVLAKGLSQCVNAKGGTAYRNRSKHYPFSGKTGTAENPHGEPHAWFAGYAPSNAPEIAFVVFIENGGHGGDAAVPIARDLIELYMSKQQESEQINSSKARTIDTSLPPE